MRIKQISKLISGNIADSSNMIRQCKGDPAINFHLNYLRSEFDIADFVKILYPNNELILPVEDFYFRISHRHLTEAEKKAIADLLYVQVETIWR